MARATTEDARCTSLSSGDGHLDAVLVNSRRRLRLTLLLGTVIAALGVFWFVRARQSAREDRVARERLASAMAREDLAGIRACIAESRLRAGDRAGEPEVADVYRPIPTDARWYSPDEARTAIDAMPGQIDASRWWRIGLDPSTLTHALREPASIVSGCIHAARARPEASVALLLRAREAAEFLVWAQARAGSGVFPFPAVRGAAHDNAFVAADRFLDRAEKEGRLAEFVRNGWAFEDGGDGGLQFDNGEAGVALVELYEATKEGPWLAAALRASGWAVSRAVVPNWNYNAFSVFLLAKAFEVTGEAKYLAAATKKARRGVDRSGSRPDKAEPVRFGRHASRRFAPVTPSPGRSPMPDLFGFDAFSPKEIAARVETVGVAKARLPLLSTVMLGAMAGAFIGFGAIGYVVVTSDATLGFATGQLLGGLAFSLGLILVVVAGAELFTGNNLLVMAWADRKISTRELLRNWAIVCVANLVGAIGLAVLVFLSRHAEQNGGAIGARYLAIAAKKCAMPFGQAFVNGLLCNALVCLAVWMAFAGRSVMDKVVAIVFPVTAFVAAGFEHSIANMFFIPMALLLKADGATGAAADAVTVSGFLGNLVPVILGNLVGGAVLVGVVYHVVYRRTRPGDERT